MKLLAVLLSAALVMLVGCFSNSSTPASSAPNLAAVRTEAAETTIAQLTSAAPVATIALMMVSATATRRVQSTRVTQPSTTQASSSSPAIQPSAERKAIATADVRVRTGPGTTYAAVGTLKKGTVVMLIGISKDGQWYQHKQGWSSAEFIQTESDTSSLPIVSVTAPTPRPATATSQPQATAGDAQVVRIVDGDTIDVSIGGQTLRVRYIGINTPETVDPNRPVECMGKEASAANTQLVEGKRVRLEKDVSETDRFGRLLRYVYVGDLFVNAELVRQGYAQVSTFPPDVKYQDLFLKLQTEARDAGRGLWRACSAPTATSAPVVRPTAGGNCHPSYPDVCIPPPPPDLDCGDIPYRRFRVTGSDPHRFDGDHDGIGCES